MSVYGETSLGISIIEDPDSINQGYKKSLEFMEKFGANIAPVAVFNGRSVHGWYAMDASILFIYLGTIQVQVSVPEELEEGITFVFFKEKNAILLYSSSMTESSLFFLTPRGVKEKIIFKSNDFLPHLVEVERIEIKKILTIFLRSGETVILKADGQNKRSEGRLNLCFFLFCHF